MEVVANTSLCAKSNVLAVTCRTLIRVLSTSLFRIRHDFLAVATKEKNVRNLAAIVFFLSHIRNINY